MPTEVSKVIGELEETRDEIAQIIRDRGSYIAPNAKLKELVPYIRSFAKPELEEGSVTSASVSVDVYPSDGYVGFSKVTVNPIPHQRKDTDVTVNGATVSIPFGYYRGNVTKTLTDSNLVADNIKKGVTIFGVTGTHEGGASVTTCTITVTFTTNAGNTLTSATTFANGAFSAFQSTTKSGTFTIQNVVCGSALSIGTTYPCTLYWSGSQQGHQSLYGGMITVPSTSGTYTVEVGVLDD